MKTADGESNRKPPLDAEALWRLARIGSATLSPDGTLAVASVTTHDAADNRARSALWRLHTDGRAPRRLTWCGEGDAQPAWSPDGRWIAFVGRRAQQGKQQGKQDERPQLYRIAPDGGEAERLSDFGPGVGGFAWAPDGRSLVFIAWVWPALRGIQAQQQQWKVWSERKDSGFATEAISWRHWDHNVPEHREPHLLRLDLATRRITDLFEGTGLALPHADPALRHFALHPDGRHIAIVHDPLRTQRSDAELAISELDLRSRRVRKLAAQTGWSFLAPAWSPDGKRLACTAAQVGRHHLAPMQLACIDFAGAVRRPRWQCVGDPAWDHEPAAPLRWTPDGRALLFTADARGRRPLWRCTLGDGHIEPLVPGGSVLGFDLAAEPTPAADVAPANTATGAAREAGPHGLKAQQGSQDPQAAQAAQAPQTPLRLLTLADSAMHPPQVHLHRADGHAPQRLEPFNDAELARHRLGAVHEVEITGALGDAVQVWWAEPAQFNPRRRHPLLHVIHGGPFAASGDSWSWRWNPHVLASRGHVVLMTNYHGSSGFGTAFKHSLVGRQGELELQDIEAATDWALAQRWADERRVFASGGSYGGFLVAWMNGHIAPGRYRAYICHAGVFDRVATFAADSFLQRPKDLAALYWQDMPGVLAQSPHTFAGRMATPTLVTHGAKDYRVPDCNGLAYYNTLKARGVPARLLWFPDENHWVLKPRNSLQWHAEFLDWLRVHDQPAAATPKPTQQRGQPSKPGKPEKSGQLRRA